MQSSPELRRRRAALRFDRVLACKCKQVKPDGKDTVLNLLAVEFEPTDSPAGVVTLTFSGGPVLRLEVECLEVELVDLGPRSGARRKPRPPRRPALGRVKSVARDPLIRRKRAIQAAVLTLKP